MKKQMITPFQLNALLCLFLLGSTVVLGLGLEVEEDAWIVTLLSSAIGILILLFYIFLIAKYELNLAELLIKGFGKYLGKFFVFLYIFYFLYIASRVVKDFTYFIAQTLFYQVEFWLISITFICIVAYGSSLGIEALARTSEILFFLVILMLLTIIAFSILSDPFDLSNLLPIFSNNWGAIFQSMFPERITFPYGELIAFTLLFPLINDKKALVKKTWIAIPIVTFLILVLTEITIAMLGAKVAALYTFPLVKSIEQIDIWDFIQHLEILSVFTFFFVGFIKVSIFFKAALYSAHSLVKFDKTKLILLFASILFLMAVFNSSSLPQHFYIGLKVIPEYIHLPFQFGIPILLFFVLHIRLKLNKN
ncbi:spore germination protein KB [Metabacillus crassostreae]|uniref:GerAB/ArcD/ProY family transporter n=1 Tax=Metabacillus crassostreae TaxID=929098 RepID=UPI00195B5375|nr:endospore germination permease [Metabacillus crassostreae]MBM7604834.1 spore germination protein KB [Metabacillus crassostreae]